MITVRCYDALKKHSAALSVALPTGTALVLGLWRISVPSYWRDESATVVAAGGPLPQLVRLLHHMDAVHGLYYLLMHGVMLLGDGEAITRLPSVLAAALTAAGVAALGGRLLGVRAGGCAGLLYALLPVVSRYAQEARSYALVGAVAVLATYLLVQCLEADRGWAPWAAYGTVLTVLGWLHLYGLFLVFAHAITVLSTRPRGRVTVRWMAAVLIAGLLVAPLAVVAVRQTGPVAWIPRPDALVLPAFAKFATGSAVLTVAVTPLLALGLTVPGPADRRERLPVQAVWMPWLLVPPLLMIGVSYAHPVYQPRYALFSVPALALGAAAGLLRLAPPGGRHRARRRPRGQARPGSLAVPGAVLATLAAVAVPAQLSVRTAAGRGDDLRTLAGVLRARSEPGDAVLYLPTSRALLAAAYQGGTGLPTDRFRSAVTKRRRLWTVELPRPEKPLGPRAAGRLAALRAEAGFRPVGHWAFGSIRLSLYERSEDHQR